MDFKTKAQLFRAFFNHHRHLEGAIDKEGPTTISMNKIGEVVITTPSESTVYKLVITDYETNGMAVRTTDNDLIICFGKKAMDAFHNNHNGFNTLKSIVAHEAGHIINGDLNQESPVIDYLNVDYNTQKTLFRVAAETSDPKAYTRYLRSTVSSMLRGGCLTQELNADLSALRFILLEDLTHIHTLDLRKLNGDNPYIALEKANRINQHNAYAKEHFKTAESMKQYKEGYQLDIYLIADSIRPYGEVVSELFNQGEEVIKEYQKLLGPLSSETPVEGWIKMTDKEIYKHPDYFLKGYKFAKDHGVDIHEYIHI